MSQTLTGAEQSVGPDRPAERVPRRAKIREHLERDWLRVLVVVLGWHALLTVAGRVLEALQSSGGSAAEAPTLFTHTLRWDAGFFLRIAEGTGYENESADRAFYPLFPLTVRLLRSALFDSISIPAAGLIVNTVATWLAALALLRIGCLLFGGKQPGWLLVATLLTAPTAFFLHAFYSEAVLAALGFGAYYFALTRRWNLMGPLLVLSTAARLPAVLFVGLCFLEFWRSRGWRLRGLVSWPVLWFPLSIGGFLGYALYLQVLTGNPRGMFDAYAGNWPYHVFNPNIAATLLDEVRTVWAMASGQQPVGPADLQDHVLPLAGLAVLAASTVYLLLVWRGNGVPLAAFGAAALIMFTLNSNVISVHRYLLPVIATNVALVHLAQRGWWGRSGLYGWMFAGVGLQSLLYALFVSGSWAG
ncbi:MAG TPA: mannosyltransferase family protein [Geodermatophilus sp.]|nr:mannosyltransferase family protein [Geodermatophilus sp.]